MHTKLRLGITLTFQHSLVNLKAQLQTRPLSATPHPNPYAIYFFFFLSSGQSCDTQYRPLSPIGGQSPLMQSAVFCAL